jgi:hypothetical protein
MNYHKIGHLNSNHVPLPLTWHCIAQTDHELEATRWFLRMVGEQHTQRLLNRCNSMSFYILVVELPWREFCCQIALVWHCSLHFNQWHLQVQQTRRDYWRPWVWRFGVFMRWFGVSGICINVLPSGDLVLQGLKDATKMQMYDYNGHPLPLPHLLIVFDWST